jgi:hypothetical protein
MMEWAVIMTKENTARREIEEGRGRRAEDGELLFSVEVLLASLGFSCQGPSGWRLKSPSSDWLGVAEDSFLRPAFNNHSNCAIFVSLFFFFFFC